MPGFARARCAGLAPGAIAAREARKPRRAARVQAFVRILVVCALASIVAATACSSSSSSATGDGGAVDVIDDGDGGVSSADGSSSAHDGSTGGDSSTGADSGVPSVPSCRETCTTPADCATPNVALYDASHYACDAGRCRWLGCQSNGECTSVYQKQNYACGAVQGLTVPSCYETCNAPSDCATPSVVLFDASHYACNANRCEWLGCKSNAECTSVYQKQNYACGAVAGIAVPSCYETCSAPSDCATPSVPIYSASHYACTQNRCEWLGCASSSECTSTFQKQNYVCEM
jgi:hypothetical protein